MLSKGGCSWRNAISPASAWPASPSTEARPRRRDPRLRRNRLHHSNQSGVILYDNGLRNIDDIDIYANGLSGVEIRNGGNPMLHGNRIYENKEAGVYVYDDGQGRLENNDIYLNSRAGMRIGNSGRPVLRRNRINKNGIMAIWAPLKGGGDVE